jgi:hypothetical protein
VWITVGCSVYAKSRDSHILLIFHENQVRFVNLDGVSVIYGSGDIKHPPLGVQQVQGWVTDAESLSPAQDGTDLPVRS